MLLLMGVPFRVMKCEYIYLLVFLHRGVLNLTVTLQSQFQLLEHNVAELHA